MYRAVLWSFSALLQSIDWFDTELTTMTEL